MTDSGRGDRERNFHDQWAMQSLNNLPNCRQLNEALTSPELRFIHSRIRPVKGLSVLDVGCGLGEASVYFALEGADVTALDLSPKMLEAAHALAAINEVKIKTHLAEAENLALKKDDKFDVIYLGNLFHHVDIQKTLSQIVPHMKANGILVSWDPVAYNPVINIYRAIAKSVRTEDEHPLKRRDVSLIKNHFKKAEIKFFWLFTLVIFILMAVVLRKNPNKERFWKVVVEDSDKWAWLYRPLEAMDRLILSLFPFLGWLCWNVVIVASKPSENSPDV